MNVLSLFDGMSCGRLALERAGIKVDNYYSAEIDKFAIKVADKNWPQDSDKRLGDVCKIKAEDLPKIDLLIGGSPCQSFSVAGDGSGFDGKSKLFWEFVRLLKECKPKYFLLENVKMKKEWEKVITDEMGVDPVEINSALVSAQNRKRLYWTNIPNVTIPTDKEVLLKDIIEEGLPFRDKSQTIPSTIYKENEKSMWKREKFGLLLTDKAIAYMDRLRNGKPRWEYHKNPLCGKASRLTANMYKGVPYGVIKEYLRKLSPIECERLQTVPDNYSDCVSNTQRYKMLGNGWTVDVIAHIFKGLNGL